MSGADATVTEIHGLDDQPTVPAGLAAPGEPARTAIEAVLAAPRRGEIGNKLAKELLGRQLPPARALVRLDDMPDITDASSFAAACRVVMGASTSGKIAPSDAAILLRNAKIVWAATQADRRDRFRLAP